MVFISALGSDGMMPTFPHFSIILEIYHYRLKPVCYILLVKYKPFENQLCVTGCPPLAAMSPAFTLLDIAGYGASTVCGPLSKGADDAVVTLFCPAGFSGDSVPPAEVVCSFWPCTAAV
jgi:hypothetical protein